MVNKYLFAVIVLSTFASSTTIIDDALMKLDLLFLTALLALSSCAANSGDEKFFRVQDGCFIPAAGFSESNAYYYIGANFWYGAILGSKTEAGDRQRLVAELDSLKALGIDNLRVLVGGDGPAGIPSQIEPSLQTAAGVYDENVFAGLDFLLSEMGKRKMSAVLYLNNAWEWSGGYARYLEWAGAGDAVLPSEAGWPAYMEYASQFVTDEKAKELFADHVRTVVSRVNTVTGVPYKDDPAIFSWQLCNEPRPFSDENKEDFLSWARESAAIIKSIDTNHLVSTGSEGLFGCEVDSSLFARLHSLEDIDYFNIHIWPYNWNWVDKGNLDSVDIAIDESRKYIGIHTDAVADAGKPLVIEEFGYPRDGFSFSKDSSVSARDIYYRYIFDIVIESARSGGCIAGCNFWAWGGYAGQSSESEYWRRGDDYCGDPAQEPQGLYSVYAGDSTTVELVRETNELIATATAGIEL